ncbi:hypothetical protein D3C73_1567360 [compost metagenome]
MVTFSTTLTNSAVWLGGTIGTARVYFSEKMAWPSRSTAKRIGALTELCEPAGPSRTRPVTPILTVIWPFETTQLRDVSSITP